MLCDPPTGDIVIAFLHFSLLLAITTKQADTPHSQTYSGSQASGSGEKRKRENGESKMIRKKALFFVVANVVVFGFLIHLFWPLIYLLILTGESDRIRLDELPPVDGEQKSDKPELIPRIIHQTWITCHVSDLLSGNCTTKPIPEKWTKAWKSVKGQNPDYEYKLWSDQNSRDFIEKEYPWFLPTWDGYLFPIQRADAIRYFVIYHYGGIYVDLDDGCQRRLDPLLIFPSFARRTTPTGIGNDIIGAKPQHPFIEMAMKSLQSYDIHWPTPYVHIMFSTGPMFFSLIWEHFNNMRPSEENRIRLLFPDEYMNKNWSFFVHYKGNSWHQWDANLMFWMQAHWIGLTVLGTIAVGLVVFGCWWCTNHFSRRRKGGWKYQPIKEAEN